MKVRLPVRCKSILGIATGMPTAGGRKGSIKVLKHVCRDFAASCSFRYLYKCMKGDTPKHAMGQCTALQAALVILDTSDTPVHMSDVSISQELHKMCAGEVKNVCAVLWYESWYA